MQINIMDDHLLQINITGDPLLQANITDDPQQQANITYNPPLQGNITDGPFLQVNETSTIVMDPELQPSVMFVIAHLCNYIFLTLGVLCNIMAVICLYKNNSPKEKNNTMRYYLIPLAVCDVLGIFWVHLSLILSDLKPPVYLHWETGCNLMPFMIFATTQLSSLLVMMITLNRFVAMFFPLKFKQLQSVKRIYWCIGILIMLVLIINWAGFGGLKPINRKHLATIKYIEFQCRGRTRIIDDYIFKVYAFIDFAVYVMIPGLVLFVCNIALVVKLHRLGKVNPVPSHQGATADLEGRVNLPMS